VPGAYRFLLVGLLAWGALAFGGVYPWAFWPMVIVAAALGVWAMPVTAAWRDPRVRVLGTALATMAAGILVQLVPLPPDLLAAVAPQADDWLRAARFGLEPGHDWRPLSLTPGATATALATFCGFGLLFLGLIRAIRHVGIPWLVTQIAALGLGLAVLGIVQRVLTETDQPLVYGFWRPEHGGNPFGPFVNRNHFAGWMVMALPLVVGGSLGLALDARRPRERVAGFLRWSMTEEAHRVLVIGAAALAMSLALVVTGSRSGLASLALGLAVVAVLMWRRLPNQAVRLAVAGYVVLVLVAAVGWAGVNSTIDRFAPASRDLNSRAAAWRDTLTVIRDFPWAGVGLGAFGDAMLVYQTGPREVIYLQAHNDYLQFAAEGGVLVGVPALVLVILILHQVRRRLASGDDRPTVAWMRAGAVGGLAAIAAQSLVEFSLRMPGNVVLFVVLLALAVHRPARPPAHAHRV
jgi:O-antigen ligase